MKNEMEFKQILEKMEEIVSENERDKIIQKYKNEKDFSMTEHEHKIIVGTAAKYALTVIKMRGPEADLAKALLWLWVAINSVKYKLNYEKFKWDYELHLLIRKYLVTIVKGNNYLES